MARIAGQLLPIVTSTEVSISMSHGRVCQRSWRLQLRSSTGDAGLLMRRDGVVQVDQDLLGGVGVCA
jgi:hypothetical protein